MVYSHFMSSLHLFTDLYPQLPPVHSHASHSVKQHTAKNTYLKPPTEWLAHFCIMQ